MKKKKRIHIDDLILESTIKDKSFLDKIDRVRYKCPECKSSFNKTDKFCNKDGSEIIKETYKVNNENYNHGVIDFLYNLDEHLNEDSGYRYIDNIEKRGDGSGYYTCFIIQRLSDEKYFYITSYEGSVDEYEFYETSPVVKTTWDFESSFD